jgi:hypothetical protein
MSSFAISYRAFDHSDAGTGGDGDPRGAMVLDCLAGTTTGLQISSNEESDFIFRLDDDAGNEVISNQQPGFESLAMPANQWVQVTLNVDRVANRVEVFFDGASQGSYDISALTGNIRCTQDLQLGVINGGNSASQAQKSGLDDVAFYPRTLTAGEISLLAAATKTPLDLLESTTPQITGYSRDEGSGEATIRFTTEAGFEYSLWRSADLVGWTEAVSSIPGTGDTATATDTPAGPPASTFYQVRKN